MVIAILRNFPGYTYKTLMDEDAEFLGIIEMTHALEVPDE
jgi:hypothetical protein